jgi:hypothetical protein
MQRCIASGGKDQYGNPQSECEDFLKASRTDPTSGKSGNGSFACQDPIYNLGVCRDFRGKVTFQDDKLVELNLEVTDRDWNDVLGDVVLKFGKPDEAHTDTEENAYGAKFDLETASWTRPEYLLVVMEKINVPYNLKRFVEVNIVDHKYFVTTRSGHTGGSALD